MGFDMVRSASCTSGCNGKTTEEGLVVSPATKKGYMTHRQGLGTKNWLVRYKPYRFHLNIE